ncbi:solute carrier family 52, riboflavin transporter, member 3-A isoform X1 [Nilaparvata lugens]|uniref:solute carrier family 52, riboflavin transporter, member 3-A isoform X1 n=2 Tax=Nilaparvata lugens TaxID=108931 RepID=UPI00193DC7F5|nr:solute carrier family 52, riboflavin transporter, member 3-A isoform X1 [Nilaparvata lugens]
MLVIMGEIDRPNQNTSRSNEESFHQPLKTMDTNTNLSEGTSLLHEAAANMAETRAQGRNHYLVVDVLAALFGISAWLSVNALYTQLPLLVQTSPEGWSLPSYLSVIIQCANIGPLLYSFTRKCHTRFFRDSTLIMFLLLLGTVAMFTISFYYTHTTQLFNEPHSTPLFSLTFCFALVGCTSSVLFIPFMNNYPEIHLVSYLVGEGLSGLIPSIVSLVQGVGNSECELTEVVNGTSVYEHVILPPLFSPKIFFLIIFSIMFCSAISFVLLNKLPTCQQMVDNKSVSNRSSTVENTNESDLQCDNTPERLPLSNASTLAPSLYCGLLLMQAVISMFANGALPSIQSYSCLPYGNTAYHLAVNLSSMANPISCFIAFFLPRTSLVTIFSMSAFSVVTTVYAITTALMSPYPPLQHHLVGLILVVSCWILFSGMVSYVKLSIAAIFRREGGKGLFWYGAVTQAGAALGSITMFYIVNFTNIFKSFDPCS